MFEEDSRAIKFVLPGEEDQHMRRRVYLFLGMCLVAALAGCVASSSMPRPTGSAVARSAQSGTASSEYVEVDYLKIVTGVYADELANSLIKVKCTFMSVLPQALPGGYSSGDYLAFYIIGRQSRITATTSVVVPKRLADSVASLGLNDEIVVYGRAVAGRRTVWGTPQKALIIEAHRIELDTSRVQAPIPPLASPPQSTIPPGAAPQPGDFNGSFAGEISGTFGGQTVSGQVTFTLLQSRDKLSGAWKTTAGASGTLSGTVVGNVASFLANQVNPCEGQFTGAVVMEDNGLRLRGSYSGPDCSGVGMAWFVVNRQ